MNCVFDTILLFPRSTTGLGWLVGTISLPCKHHHRHRQLPLRFQITTCPLISASSFWSLHNHEVNFCLQSRPYLHSPLLATFEAAVQRCSGVSFTIGTRSHSYPHFHSSNTASLSVSAVILPQTSASHRLLPHRHY